MQTKEAVLMNSRYLTNITIALIAGFSIVASQAFTNATYSWLMFGCGVAIGAVALGSIALRGRGLVQRSLDGAVGVLSAWTIVSSLVFGSVVWLGFSAAVAVAAVAIAGLTANELATERVVHSLEPSSYSHGHATHDGRAVVHA
jgi:hypothetical protein